MSKRYTIQELEESGVEFRPIPGVVGYSAGSDGRVYSFRRPAGPGRKGYATTCFPLAPRPNSDGYLNVALFWRGRRDESVHRLIASVFHGPRPAGCQCSHLDGDPQNNRPENLTYESCADNIRRKNKHGTTAKGETHGISKLYPEDVRYIRREHESGRSQEEIAWELGIAQSTVSSVIRRKTWGHVD